MAAMALLRLMLCAASVAWGHRVQRLEHMKPDVADEEALLKEAQLAFKPPRFYLYPQLQPDKVVYKSGATEARLQ